jgi:hypothetical protein
VKHWFAYVALAALSLAACSKAVETSPSNNDTAEFTEYIIKKGDHYANKNDFKSVKVNKLSFIVLFDSSCIYSTAKHSNAGDVNKLYGFSDCNTQHHQNSARFGWLWNGEALEIYAYCYNNSIRESKLIGTVPISQEVRMSISVQGSTYVFEMNGKTETMQRNCSGNVADGYQLYPYFGGDEVAPHDIRILIRDVR